MQLVDDKTFAFESFTLDLGRGCLHNSNGEIELRPKSFEVLRYLVANAGRLVTKEELLHAVWPQVTVTDESLTRCISDIRFALEDRESRIIKTVPRRGYRFEASVSLSKAQTTNEDFPSVAPLSLPEGPSIAILPFQNMSGDPEQDYFADGIVEEITVALSRFKWLFVISRNSSFSYKGKSVDVRQVGRELGVRYVLEGSVRKADGQLRITGQLIDAESGTHLWADRFQGKLSDVFALQDELTVSVIAAIEPRLLHAEVQLAVRRRPDDLGAYDMFLKALPHFYLMTKEGIEQSRQLCMRALEIDERYAAAAGIICECHHLNIGLGWSANPAAELEQVVRFAKIALSLNENDPDTLGTVGRMTAYLLGDRETAVDLVDRAVALNPNSALGWLQHGWTYLYCNRPAQALGSFERAVRLNPLDPQLFLTLGGMAIVYIALDRLEDAVTVARRAISQNDQFAVAIRSLAAALALLGRKEEAQEAADHHRKVEPDFTIGKMLSRSRLRFQSDQLLDGLRKAGFPE